MPAGACLVTGRAPCSLLAFKPGVLSWGRLPKDDLAPFSGRGCLYTLGAGVKSVQVCGCPTGAGTGSLIRGVGLKFPIRVHSGSGAS